MADFEINLKTEANKLGKDLENIGESTVKELKKAVEQLSLNVYAEADRLAAQRLHTARDTYRNALKYEKLADDIYVVYLDPNSSAKYYEEGFSSFDMKAGLLNGPKAKVSAKGTKYNIVPLQIQPFSQEPTKQKVVADLREAVRKLTQDKSVEKRVKKFNVGERQVSVTTYPGATAESIKGLTKVSYKGQSINQAQYILFRMVSSNSDGWIHPGYGGLHLFSEDLPRYVEENMQRILKALL